MAMEMEADVQTDLTVHHNLLGTILGIKFEKITSKSKSFYFRNERMPSPRRGNGYQQHSYVAGGGGGSGGGYYNPNNRYEYGSFGSNRHEEHDFSYKRSRSLYEGSGGYYNNHSSNFPHEPSYYDSNKKFRRDWLVLKLNRLYDKTKYLELKF
jgi:hypothetical protein